MKDYLIIVDDKTCFQSDSFEDVVSFVNSSSDRITGIYCSLSLSDLKDHPKNIAVEIW